MDKTRNYDENRLATGIKLANMRIFETRRSASTKYKGMGTTIVTVHFAPDARATSATSATAACTSSAAGMLKQVTEDHSLLNDYLKAKKLTPEEIEDFPHKNVIVRALGMKDTVQVDVSRVEPQEGDIFLLCSDGLSGMVTGPADAGDPQRSSRISKGLRAADRHGQRRTAATTTSPACWPATTRLSGGAQALSGAASGARPRRCTSTSSSPGRHLGVLEDGDAR